MVVGREGSGEERDQLVIDLRDHYVDEPNAVLQAFASCIADQKNSWLDASVPRLAEAVSRISVGPAPVSVVAQFRELSRAMVKSMVQYSLISGK